MAFDKPFSLITEAEIRKKYMYLSAADKTLFDEARHAPEHGPNCKCMTGTVGANSFGDPVKVYPIGSRFNHSCDPNVMMLMPLPGQSSDFQDSQGSCAGRGNVLQLQSKARLPLYFTARD